MFHRSINSDQSSVNKFVIGKNLTPIKRIAKYEYGYKVIRMYLWYVCNWSVKRQEGDLYMP